MNLEESKVGEKWSSPAGLATARAYLLSRPLLHEAVDQFVTYLILHLGFIHWGKGSVIQQVAVAINIEVMINYDTVSKLINWMNLQLKF